MQDSMPDIQDLEARVKELQVHEEKTARFAAVTLSEAMRARREAKLAWIELQMARGAKASFQKYFNECTALKYRADHHSPRYVRGAMKTGLLSELINLIR